MADKDNAESDNGVPAAPDPARDVARAAASSRPVRKSSSAADSDGKKDHATPKQHATGTARARKRATPAGFVRESVGELRKVVWPTANQLRQYFIVVLVFVLLVILYVTSLDLLFGWGLLQLFG
ncbi:preprotein translocase subunit SecE [Micropruina sp.]|uniref:preprotein translocase subunit SecE n=1 Tax=Micropruina sp. TaxID=2737536 RepID=UPI002620B003|nr:preprotein translocase subunit SecE [Micropruina sp.]